MGENAEWLLNDETQASDIVDAIQKHLTAGMSPTFTAANLGKDVIRNCAIDFVKSSDCKAEVNAFIEKLISIDPSAASKVADGFYYV